MYVWSSWPLPELPEGRLLSTRHANDFSVNFGVRRGVPRVDKWFGGSRSTPMVKLTFPPKTELSRESGADLDFQDILVRWRKSLPTVSYFLGGTSIRFPDGGEIRCFQPAGGKPHAHVPEARWRIYIGLQLAKRNQECTTTTAQHMADKDDFLFWVNAACRLLSH